MFIRYEKIKNLFVFLLVALCILLVSVGAYHEVAHVEYTTIVIDAGHGGKDGGVVGSDGTLESTLNLDIARRLERVLLRKGYRVVMTRRDERALGDGKKADMRARAELIKNCDADMVVSIHINKYSDSRRRGVQVFYDDTDKWQKEGTLIQNIMNEYINKRYGGRHDYTALGGDYFITKCVDIPSLIVECGFISNREDERLLHDDHYKDDLARYIAIGIDSIMGV